MRKKNLTPKGKNSNRLICSGKGTVKNIPNE